MLLAVLAALWGCDSASNVAVSRPDAGGYRQSPTFEGVAGSRGAAEAPKKAETAKTSKTEETADSVGPAEPVDVIETVEPRDDIVGDIILEFDPGEDVLALDGRDEFGIGALDPEANDEEVSKRVRLNIEAAFESLAERQSPVNRERDFALPKKRDGFMRIALLVPRSGVNRRLGTELQQGAELALFSLRNPEVELLVFDSAAEGGPVRAAKRAVRAKADIIIGPLFSEAVIKARAVARRARIPMLALSNNTEIIGRGSWILGYAPEQQIDLLITHAFSEGLTRVGIIVEPTPFGRRLAKHAMRRLEQFDLVPEVVTRLSKSQIVNDDELNEALQDFTGYVPPDEDGEDADSDAETLPSGLQISEEEFFELFEDEGLAALEYGIDTVEPLPEELPPPRFDAILFAGDADFALRTAPVLAFFDSGPERVTYLGNSQWNQRRILLEPSLQGGVFASRPTENDEQFASLWASAWTGRPGILARLSFDAIATVAVLSRHDRKTWNDVLVTQYRGFSGPYRLLPNGGIKRGFELREVRQGNSNLLQSSPDNI